MSEYRKLNLSALKFSDTIISHEEALKDVTPFRLSNDAIESNKKIIITKAEKDYENKCVKLGTSY